MPPTSKSYFYLGGSDVDVFGAVFQGPCSGSLPVQQGSVGNTCLFLGGADGGTAIHRWQHVILRNDRADSPANVGVGLRPLRITVSGG